MAKYLIQTKLYHVEDVLVAWGPVRLTLRQCFVLILGGCGSLNLWSVLDGLTDNPWLSIRIALAILPTLLALLLAMVRVADRYGEAWALVLLGYATHPHVSIWRPERAKIPHRNRRSQNRRNKKTHRSRENGQ